MSKKKFKAGLESLFGDVGTEDRLPGIRPLLVEKEKNKKAATGKEAAKKTRKRSSKSFTTNLEDLFNDALEKETFLPTEETKATANRDTVIKKRRERPIIGIDALIRRTSTTGPDDQPTVSSPLKKRVTVTLEKKKIEKLKSIAKSQKAYLRDIVDEIISAYLKEKETTGRSADQ